MSKDKRQCRHFMDETYRINKKIRKLMPKASRIIKEDVEEKCDWRKVLDVEVDNE